MCTLDSNKRPEQIPQLIMRQPGSTLVTVCLANWNSSGVRLFLFQPTTTKSSSVESSSPSFSVSRQSLEAHNFVSEGLPAAATGKSRLPWQPRSEESCRLAGKSVSTIALFAARERSRFVALHSWRPRASRLSHPMLFNNIHSQNVIDPGLCGKDQQSETFHFLSSKLSKQT